jgi:phosphoribosylaminoimidazolecarboxamide formyltransferase/IMP cyclohydrolase
MLDGRVKTLHPKIHAGILAMRSNAQHMRDIAAHGIDPIDLVVVNLYPFAKTAAEPGKPLEDVVEMIDIGGPSMVRGAAKNWEDVGVVDAADYPPSSKRSGRRGLDADALFAFRRRPLHTPPPTMPRWRPTWRALPRRGGRRGLPAGCRCGFRRRRNSSRREPAPKEAFYRDPQATGTSLATAKQLQGKPLSFNNLRFRCGPVDRCDFREHACVIVKHGNPRGRRGAFAGGRSARPWPAIPPAPSAA